MNEIHEDNVNTCTVFISIYKTSFSFAVSMNTNKDMNCKIEEKRKKTQIKCFCFVIVQDSSQFSCSDANETRSILNDDSLTAFRFFIY